MEMDVEAYLRRRYEGQVADIEIVQKEDLNLVTSHSPLLLLPSPTIILLHHEFSNISFQISILVFKWLVYYSTQLTLIVGILPVT